MSGVLSIARAGLACPVGLRSAPALAAMRAGVSRFATPDERPEVTVCRLSTVPDIADRSERMCTLLGHAIDEVLEDRPGRWPDELPLFVSLPSPGLGGVVDEAGVIDMVRRKVVAATGARLHAPPSAMVREGRSGIFGALHQAATILPRSRFPLALIVAVDSLVDPVSLAELSRERLLLEPPRNLDGRIPGEGAAVFLVGLPNVLPRAEALGHVQAIEIDHDPASFMGFHRGTALNRAHGLARVFRRLGGAFPGRANVVVSGQPSEGYWGRELSYAYLRNVALMPEPFVHIGTGVEVGDAGAAAGGIAIHRALGELAPHWCRGVPGLGNALVYGVSDDGRMGALALFSAGARR